MGGRKQTHQVMVKAILKEYRKVESILKMHADVNEIEANIQRKIDYKNKLPSYI